MTSLSLAFLSTVLLGAAHAITIQTVTIGDPGNPNDPSTGGLYGGVTSTYAIGKYEVTLIEYTAFLNAVAATDTYSLYNPSMATDLNIAGISRSGSSGSFSYSVIGDANRPVTNVSWFDAARFTNWLHNGQPTGLQVAGTTETGAYALIGATSGVAFSKSLGAQYWIPSESEWYKAAYYQPAVAGGDADGYWDYPTKSNSVPGNNIGATANQANYNNGAYSVTQIASYSSTQNYLTLGGAYSGSASYYGTFDQGGNVYEWNDAVIFGSTRGVRGGAWDGSPGGLHSSVRVNEDPEFEYRSFGFRIATVPEPTGAVNLVAAGLLLLARRQRPS